MDGAIIKKNVQRVITDPEIDAALVPVIENQKDLTVVYEELVESPENFEEVCQVREILKLTKLLVSFVNNQLSKLELEIDNLLDLADGSKLVLLAGLIGNFFVQFSKFHIEPLNEEQSVRNLKFAWKLYENMGNPNPNPKVWTCPK